ncbi:MAG: AMP-binding protein [Iphinoe sp. HA4291-MV1]|jgi:non-ribosomal peptide synthetase component F|nr:AMP-binding protein [Iphinoe sp. HA4291-MV1]
MNFYTPVNSQINLTQPKNQCIHQLFEAQVERTPGAVAVVFEHESFTYHQLNSRANKIAHYLQALGVSSEMLVGICMERSVSMVVGLLGILKAGAAYVPLDPAYPGERLAFMLEDSQATVLLTLAEHIDKLPLHSARVVCLDSDWSEIAQHSSENPTSEVTLDNLVYTIYTSGSTGKPKGVLIEHRGLLNLVKWHQRTFAVSPKDRATMLAGPAFDASVWELWPNLTAGATIHIVNEQTRRESLLLRDWLVKNAITISFLPTPLAESIFSRPKTFVSQRKNEGLGRCFGHRVERSLTLAGELIYNPIAQNADDTGILADCIQSARMPQW